MCVQPLPYRHLLVWHFVTEHFMKVASTERALGGRDERREGGGMRGGRGEG